MSDESPRPVKTFSAVRTLAVLWGILFLLGGILGFVPGVTKDEMFLGFFMVNTPHNILHIISGVMFLIGSLLGARTARSWFLIFGIFYLALSIIGFKVGDGLIFGLISNTRIDAWGHGFLGLVLFLTGLFAPKAAGCRGTGCGKGKIDKDQFGPWAVVTGASSGIGKEFARQIAASGINLVLVARREALLEEVGVELSKICGIEHRVVVADLSDDRFMEKLITATEDLDVGLVVSNAGTASPGKLLTKNLDELIQLLRLNTRAHLEIAHHFARKLGVRGRGGLLFVGAMGSEIGIPYMANDAGAKSYMKSFAQALHVELGELGVNVTILTPGPTETPVLEKFGFVPEKMPMKPMQVEQCVSEGLEALQQNCSVIIPGRINRIMNAVVPASITRSMMAKLFASVETGKAG
jgi:short-subunit dehydrogenase